MPQFDQDTRDKIVLLRGLRNLGTPIEGPYEIVKIEWPAPTGTKYYATTAVDEVASVAPPITVELRLIPDNLPNSFLPLSIDSTIGDEEVDLTFWDADDAISDEVVAHGEGLRVTLLYWFPQVDLLLPVWEGHLRAEDEGEVDRLMLKAVQGFRSSDASIPSRAHYAYCQAIFGGTLTTQEEINEHGCNYNRHLSGAVGTLDPATGQPWTFCPRRTTADCTARGVNPLRHLSHQTIVTTTSNPQSSGPRLLSTSQGNETNLTEPVTVIMGTRRKYDMKVMAYVRFPNQNPTQGWFYAFYEAAEGPVHSITQARVTINGVTKNDPFHLGLRLGNFGDASPDGTISPHSFSATAFMRFAYQMDPTAVDPEDASGSALISGLRDIRVYGVETSPGSGLKGEYFTDMAWTSLFATRVDGQVNFPSSHNPPLEGMLARGFSIEWTGEIYFPATETVTFNCIHDDSLLLVINGSTVINAPLFGTTSGTFNATADTWVTISVKITQLDAAPSNPWAMVLRWNSTALGALHVVPSANLRHDGIPAGSYTKMPTSNRAWQIARMLCDKRWGNGYDYARLNIASWMEAATWVAEYVRFTDTFGTNWDHARGMSDVELIERKVQQQIEDMCISGRLSRPFLFDGEIHIMPLKALTSGELDACPEFTDEGDDRNIIWEGDEGEEKSTLKFSRKSDLDLPNRIECTYDSAADDYKKTPLQPVEDVDAQLRAGRVIGDKSRKINVKKYHLLGVVSEAHAMKLAWSILDLGPIDEGGLQNNLKLTFKVWFLDAIDLHQEKVIKVTSSRITKYGFTHFRVKKMERADNLHYELTVQAYAHTYMATFETLLTELAVPPVKPEAPRPPPPAPKQCVLQFGTITYTDGILDIPVPQCAGETAILDGGAVATVFANITDGGNSSQTYTTGYDGGPA